MENSITCLLIFFRRHTRILVQSSLALRTKATSPSSPSHIMMGRRKRLSLCLSLLLLSILMISEGTWGQSSLPDSCQKGCVLDSECGIGGLCRSGICTRKSVFCANELWSTNSRGEAESCQNYKCSENTGLCLTSALQPDDCTFGYTMDAFHQCIPQVQCNFNDPSCLPLLEKWKTARIQYESTMPTPQLESFSCRSCNLHSDCLTSEMCWRGQCAAEGRFCSGDTQAGYISVLVVNKMESRIACGQFACGLSSGTCKSQCQSDSDCIQGSRCLQKTCQK